MNQCTEDLAFLRDEFRDCMDRANAAEAELTAIRKALKEYQAELLNRSKGVVVWRKEVAEKLDIILEG
jgi:hypothetical protein